MVQVLHQATGTTGFTTYLLRKVFNGMLPTANLQMKSLKEKRLLEDFELSNTWKSTPQKLMEKRRPLVGHAEAVEYIREFIAILAVTSSLKKM